MPLSILATSVDRRVRKVPVVLVVSRVVICAYGIESFSDEMVNPRGGIPRLLKTKSLKSTTVLGDFRAEGLGGKSHGGLPVTTFRHTISSVHITIPT